MDVAIILDKIYSGARELTLYLTRLPANALGTVHNIQLGDFNLLVCGPAPQKIIISPPNLVHIKH